MSSYAFNPYATVSLHDIDDRDSFPDRTIVLEAPRFEVKIGRGTLSGDSDLCPAPENAWFESRVLSRNHAVLRADPSTKDILIKDVGSMHGTHIGGRRLKTNHDEALWPGDVITMGADVTRGSNYFSALQVAVSWKWSDESDPSRKLVSSSRENVSGSTFSPDYSEGEYYEELCSEVYNRDNAEEGSYQEEEVDADGEIDLVQESIVQTSIEIMIPPSRTFAVPESDVSDQSSYSSDAESTDAESPTSSPSGLYDKTDDEHKTTSSAPITKLDMAPTPLRIHQTSPIPISTSTTSANLEDATWTMDVSEENDYEDDVDDDAEKGDAHDTYGSSHVELLDVTSALPQGGQSCSDLQERSEGPVSPSNSPTSSALQREAFRTPSPSDAALAKPFMEPLHAPPFISDTKHDAIAENIVSEQSRSSTAWAGHNSILYEPMPANVSHCDSVASPVVPTPSVFRPHNLDENMWLSQLPADPLPHVRKVPIARLLVETPGAGSLESNSNELKRKADLISSDTILQEKGPAPGRAAVEHADFAPAAGVEEGAADSSGSIETKLPSTSEWGSKACEEMQVQTGEMPPPKKVKMSKHKSTNHGASAKGSFIKLAAATVTGMAIGTVGTIIGLAALPPDYFI